jgi:hypothetical protein
MRGTAGAVADVEASAASYRLFRGRLISVPFIGSPTVRAGDGRVARAMDARRATRNDARVYVEMCQRLGRRGATAQEEIPFPACDRSPVFELDFISAGDRALADDDSAGSMRYYHDDTSDGLSGQNQVAYVHNSLLIRYKFQGGFMVRWSSLLQEEGL